MQAQPSRSHRPLGSRHPQILRSGVAPDVGVVVAYKAAAVIHFPCGNSAVWAHFFYMIEQRSVKLAQIADLRRPVIHFSIYIYGEFTAPCRPHILIPDPLEIHRQGTLPASGYHEVTSEVEIKLHKLVVASSGTHLFKSLVGRQCGGSAAVVLQRYFTAAVIGAVILYMLRFQLLVGFLSGTVDIIDRLSLVIVVAVAGLNAQ